MQIPANYIKRLVSLANQAESDDQKNHLIGYIQALGDLLIERDESPIRQKGNGVGLHDYQANRETYIKRKRGRPRKELVKNIA